MLGRSEDLLFRISSPSTGEVDDRPKKKPLGSCRNVGGAQCPLRFQGVLPTQITDHFPLVRKHTREMIGQASRWMSLEMVWPFANASQFEQFFGLALWLIGMIIINGPRPQGQAWSNRTPRMNKPPRPEGPIGAQRRSPGRLARQLIDAQLPRLVFLLATHEERAYQPHRDRPNCY